MNTKDSISCQQHSTRHPQLLERIRSALASVGDGLSDFEFTLFVQQRALPAETGFTFLCFSEGVVTLSVPPQDLSTWYPDQGWIRPEKEQIAKRLAGEYGLSICEPPDQTPHYVLPSDARGLHHHIEMQSGGTTVVVAHPQYLKVRLFESGRSTYSKVPVELAMMPDLLRHLSALYES